MDISQIVTIVFDRCAGGKGFSTENAAMLIDEVAFRRAAARKIGVTSLSLSRATSEFLQDHAGEIRSAWRDVQREAVISAPTAISPRDGKDADASSFWTSVYKGAGFLIK